MPNKLENNEIVSEPEKVYYNTQNLQGEMMRYKNNSLSYKLGMLGILMSILGAFISLNSIVWDFWVIFKILMNIIILLFGFLSIEKAKAYSKTYSYVLVGIGVACFLRIFWYPLILIRDYATYLSTVGTENVQMGHLGPTITGTYIKNAYLWMDGYVRGVIAIVFLGLATASFLGAGIVGLIRSKKYAEFMATQDTTKGV